MKKFFLTTIVLIVVLALAVFGTVWALNHFSGGLPFSQRCTATASAVGSHNLAPDQADNAALISAISLQRDLPARAATIGIATAMQESKLRNIDYGDRDSLGLFQQRPSQGWGTEEQVQDPRYATEAFYDVLARIEGYDDMAVTVAAQAVQRSAFPDAYAQHEDVARAFASALTGHAPAALNCRLHPVEDTEEADIARFAARLNADFPGIELATSPTEVSVSHASLDAGAQAFGIDSHRMQWALANWVVAVADTYGIESVTAADQIWTRTEPWTASDEEGATNAPSVVVRFAEAS